LNRKIKIFNFRFFLLLFLISFLILFYIEGPRAKENISDFSSIIPPDLLIEDAWYEVYFHDAFIGYSHFFMKVQSIIEEGAGYVLKNTSQFNLPILGFIRLLNLDIKVELGNNYNLRNVYFEMRSKEYFFKGSLERKQENTYSLTIKTPTQNIHKIISFKNELIASLFIPIPLNYIPLRKKISFSLYDPFLEKKLNLILENKGKTVININNQDIEVFIIEMDLEGVKGKVYIDSRGRVIKEKILDFIFIKVEPQTLFSKQLSFPFKDLTEYFTVETSSLPDKEKLRYLKIKIKGISSQYIKDTFNQKVYYDKDELIVEIFKKEPYRIEYLPFKKEEFSEYLKEDEFIKCSSFIKEKALSIVGKEKDPMVILKKMSEWINKNIKKVPTISLPNTMDVLRLKQGDCAELSALLVGFLRSLGIPSYVNIGLVYNKGKFFYHAWVSLYVGEWIDTDPALNQIIADPTHIKLFEGFKNQFEIFRVINKPKIDILEYK